MPSSTMAAPTKTSGSVWESGASARIGSPSAVTSGQIDPLGTGNSASSAPSGMALTWVLVQRGKRLATVGITSKLCTGGGDARNEVERRDAELRAVGVDAPGHAEQPDQVHREEGQVHPDEHQGEVPSAEGLGEQPACHLGPPVVHPGEQPEDSATEEDIVEVGDDVVRVGLLQIGGRGGVGDAGEATDGEQRDEAEGEEHR